MKIALIHDHLAQDGGAEKVLKVLSDMYPDAPIYTLLYEKKQVSKYFKGKDIKTSIIQRLPGGVKHYQWYLPFMPMAVEFFDLRDFDIVISDASAFAKGVITSPSTLHICYCHTPTRYLWDYTHQYINELRYNKYLKKVISLLLSKIRMWDRLAADRVDLFIANSETVQKRIRKYYRRDSIVIYPPVELEQFSVKNDFCSKDLDIQAESCLERDSLADAQNDRGYFLIGGRLAPYKRVDIVVEAFKEMPDKNLKIFGDGVDLKRLKKIAEEVDNIEFLGRVNDKEKVELYKNCEAFINPQIEDFGITVVEAMASGRPVIAYREGGAVETIIENETGIFFDKQNKESLIEAIKDYENRKFDSEVITKNAQRFSKNIFRESINRFVKEKHKEFKK
ncbi:glycosyltransferase [Candidatus Parcubacteria bacterium]|nr:glycosyltransferase [Candidatus Parcubacteria bacterium]